MRLFLFALTAMLLAGAEHAVLSPPVERAVSVQQLGFEKGLVFDSSESIQTLYFPVPRDANVLTRTLVIRLRSSPLLKEPSNFRVLVEDVPLRALSLADGNDEPQEIRIPLPGPALASRSPLKVTFGVSARLLEGVCLDGRPQAGFVHVLPDSGLSVTTDGAKPVSVRGFADMLPDAVVVSLSSQRMTEQEFAAAWRVAEFAHKSRRRVRFVRLPARGDIVIASNREIDAAFPNAGTPQAANRQRSNLEVRHLESGAFLAVTEPFQFGAELLDSDWLPLAQSASYLTRPGHDSSKPLPDRLTLRLGSLRMQGAGLQESSESSEWQVTIGANDLPAHYRVREAAIEVVAAPRVHDQPHLIHVYRNNHLLRSFRLPDDGEAHRFTVDVPEGTAGRESYFRIVSQRLLQEGECQGTAPALPIQLLPGTSFVAKFERRNPVTIDEAGDYFRRGFVLYLDPEHFDRPELLLPFLGRMAESLDLPLDRARVAAYPVGQPFADQPFLLVSQRAPEGMLLPVRFDRGRVEVLDANGRVLLDADNLPGITLAQLARAGEQVGIWLRPSGVLPEEGFRPELGDVLFLDKAGLVRALNSRAPDETQLRYPQFRDWTNFLRDYRYWLFAAFWLLLTCGFVQLYRKLSRSKGVA